MLSMTSTTDLITVIERNAFAEGLCPVPRTDTRSCKGGCCQRRCSRCSSDSSLCSQTLHTSLSSRPSSSTTISLDPVTPTGSIHGVPLDEKCLGSVSSPPPYDASTFFDTLSQARPKELKRPASLPTFASSHEATDTKLSTACARRLSCVAPREEEGCEELPPYRCTVYKMGYAQVKREMLSSNARCRWRCWRTYYLELRGTMLCLRPVTPFPFELFPFEKVYSSIPFLPAGPQDVVATVSLAGADAVRALDYSRRPHVLRLTTAHGEQLLLRLKNYVEMISWIEHLQAGINISLDLEHRPMPKFTTLPSRTQGEVYLNSRVILMERQREERRRNQDEALI